MTAPVLTAPASLPYVPVHFEGDLIAITEHNGEPYVGMKAVVVALGLAWTSQFAKLRADSILGPSMTEIVIETPAGPRPSAFLPLKFLAGYLFKITPSKVAPALRPKIEAYQRQAYDVLNAAFQDAYRPKEAPPAGAPGFGSPLQMAEYLKELSEQFIVVETRRLELEQNVQTMQPKADRHDRILTCEGTLSVGEVAKQIKLGRNDLFKMLRDDGYLISGGSMRNTPYQRYLDQGLFRVITTTGGSLITTQTRVTAKGLAHITDRYGA